MLVFSLEVHVKDIDPWIISTSYFNFLQMRNVFIAKFGLSAAITLGYQFDLVVFLLLVLEINLG